ncbi:MAG: OmpA family protein [Cyclobacteriaceae bacterium]
MAFINIRKPLLIVLMVYLTVFGHPGFSRNHENPHIGLFPDYLSSGVYLIVGVFSFEDNAKKFTSYVSKQGWTVNYAYYPETQYYYVYTFNAKSTDKVVDACLELRVKSEFSDAWVFVAPPSEDTPIAKGTSAPDLWDSQESVSDEAPAIEVSATEVSAPKAPESSFSNSDQDETEASPVVHSPEVAQPEVAQNPLLYLKFKAFHSTTQKPVQANVNVVDGIRAKSLASTTTGETQEIDKSGILDSMLQITPYAVGYRKVQFDLPLYASMDDSIRQITEWQGDTLIMNMPLLRLKKGDIQVLYDTYFHGNSSVMRERSRYEIDELVKMLEESPDMRIKLHGHTNGAGRGFIYTFLPEEKNFFDLRRGKEYKKNGVGSTKLSALRAETIKSYLEHKGIAADRIETVGWGGKKMLYDPDSPLAKHNIRVEVEVLDE